MKNRMVNSVSVGRALVVAGALFSFGCGDSGDGGGEYEFAPVVDCDSVTPKKFSELQPVFAKCLTCHSVNVVGADRKAAPPGTDYDTYAGAKEEFVKIADRVFDPNAPMPPKDGVSTALTDAEKADLNAWSQCGAPE